MQKIIVFVFAIVLNLSTLKSQDFKILHSSYQALEIELKTEFFSLEPIENETYGKFAYLKIENLENGGEIGYPSLPYFSKIIEIPFGAQIQIETLSQVYQDFKIDLPVYPKQRSIQKNSKETPKFEYRKEIYLQDGFLNLDLVEVRPIGESRGCNLAQLIIRPLEYSPAEGILRLNKFLRAKIYFTQADIETTRRKKRIYSSPSFGAVSRLGVNRLEVEASDVRALGDPGAAGGGGASGAADGNLGGDPGAAASSPNLIHEKTKREKYVIVSNEAFKDALQEFIKWKKLQGFEIVEAYTSAPSVGKTAESIQKYLQELYDSATETNAAPSYVLLVGDLELMPSFRTRCDKDSWVLDGNHVTDLYYVEYTGDRLPDAFIGRISVQKDSVNQLNSQLRKIMSMAAIDPDLSAKKASRAIFVAGMDNEHGNSHLNNQLKYIQNEYFKPKTAIGETAKFFFYPNTKNAEESVIEEINTNCALVCYTGHGEVDGWRDPDFRSHKIDFLKNKEYSPFCIANCCFTASFDLEGGCFGEKLTRSSSGVVGYIGATNYTYFDQDFYWTVGYANLIRSPFSTKEYNYQNTNLGAFDAFFHTNGEDRQNQAHTASEIIYLGNMSVENTLDEDFKLYYWEIYTLFGDPSFMPYRGAVEKIEIGVQDSICIDCGDINLYTKPYASLALSQGEKFERIAYANQDGELKMPIGDLAEGRYTLYSRAQFASDSKKEVYFYKAKNLAIALQSAEFFNRDLNRLNFASSAEELDKIFIYGETYSLNLGLKNVGSEKIDSLRIRLSAQTKYVELETSASEHLPRAVSVVARPVAVAAPALEKTYAINLSPDETASLDAVAFLKILENVPQGEMQKLRLQIFINQENTACVDRILAQKAAAPQIDFVSVALVSVPASQAAAKSEPAAHGSAHPAVPATAQPSAAQQPPLSPNTPALLEIKLKNSGNLAAENLILRLQTNRDFINLEKTEHKIKALQVGDTASLRLPISAKNTMPYSDFYTIELEAVTRSRLALHQENLLTPPLYETFESGDLSYAPWLKESTWIVTDSTKHIGKYALESSPIEHSSSTVAAMKVNVTLPDKIGFYYKTSSESHGIYGDNLLFYIDGELKNSWKGIQDWKYVEYAVDSGEHLFSWVYAKDQAESDGQDRVWIDDIRLPIGAVEPELALEKKLSKPVTEVQDMILKQLTNNEIEIEIELNSKTRQNAKAYILDIMGKKVCDLANKLPLEIGSNSFKFRLCNLNKALYICVLEAQEANYVVKFIKK